MLRHRFCRVAVRAATKPSPFVLPHLRKTFATSSNEKQKADDTIYQQVKEILKRKEIDHAQQYVANLPTQQQHPIFNTLIVEALTRAKRSDDAINIVQRSLNSGITPSIFTFNSLIHGLVNEKRLDEGENWLNTMLKLGMQPTAYTFYPMFTAFGKAGRVEDVERIFYDVMPPHLLKEGNKTGVYRLVQAIISTYRVNDMEDKAIAFLESLPASIRKKSGFKLVPQNRFR
jgi:pentatricopeptide repeat protein